MTKAISGGCKCGAVRYLGELSDVSPFRCYCRDCQRLTGTGHAEMFPLVAETFQLVGPRAEYQMTGGSGKFTWSGFCTACGSPLTRRSERKAHCLYVHASSLDKPEIYRPRRSIYTEAAQPWDEPTLDE